jgi:hypothetical protein
MVNVRVLLRNYKTKFIDNKVAMNACEVVKPDLFSTSLQTIVNVQFVVID